MKSFFIVVTCLTLFSFPASSEDPSSDVPLSHRFYQTVDRFQARGWLPSAPGHRPFTRIGAARLLIEIFQRAASGGHLSKTEQGILERHRDEFAWELASLGHRVDTPERGIVGRISSGDDLLSWQDSSASFSIDPLFREQVLVMRGGVRPEETVSQTYVGAIVRGTYKGRFGFRVRHYEARESSTRARLSRQDVLARPVEDVQLKGKSVDFRQAEFQLVLATPWVDLDIGKNSLDWGPGRTGNLLLTNNASSFPMVRLRAEHGRFRFVHVVGFLRAREGLIDSSRTRRDNGHLRTFRRRKQVSAHRFEILLPKGVLLGLQETVVYGDRAVEFLYANPATVLAAAQTYLGDNDNILIGLDLRMNPRRNVQLYLGVLFDDLNKFYPGSFSNKYALQLGLQWVDPFGLSDTEMRAEYLRLEPFVYSHKFDINTYEHFGALLGHPLGPNADNIFGSVVHHVSPSFRLSLFVERERQGENTLTAEGLRNVGGNAQQGRRPSDAARRRFLSGILEKRTRLGFALSCEPVRDLTLRISYDATLGDNILLARGERGNGSATTWTFATDFNFF